MQGWGSKNKHLWPQPSSSAIALKIWGDESKRRDKFVEAAQSLWTKKLLLQQGMCARGALEEV